MRIHNRKTGEVIETRCHGCMCHELPVSFGLTDGCCSECGCPQTIAAFEQFKLRAEGAARSAGQP